MSIRLQGQFLLVGATGTILSFLLIFLIPGPDGLTGPESIPTNVVFVISGLLLLVGLPALYRAQAKQIRRWGLVGVLLLWVAIVLVLLILSFVQILDRRRRPTPIRAHPCNRGTGADLDRRRDRGNHDDPCADLSGSAWLGNAHYLCPRVTRSAPEQHRASWNDRRRQRESACICCPGLGGCDPQFPWEPHTGLAVFGPTQLATNDQDAALSCA